MKPKSKMLVAVVLGLAFASIGCAEKGACLAIIGAGGIGSTCADDRTAGTCFVGTLHVGATCADLGFRVTDKNPTMGSITGV